MEANFVFKISGLSEPLWLEVCTYISLVCSFQYIDIVCSIFLLGIWEWFNSWLARIIENAVILFLFRLKWIGLHTCCRSLVDCLLSDVSPRSVEFLDSERVGPKSPRFSRLTASRFSLPRATRGTLKKIRDSSQYTFLAREVSSRSEIFVCYPSFLSLFLRRMLQIFLFISSL